MLFKSVVSCFVFVAATSAASLCEFKGCLSCCQGAGLAVALNTVDDVFNNGRTKIIQAAQSKCCCYEKNELIKFGIADLEYAADNIPCTYPRAQNVQQLWAKAPGVNGACCDFNLALHTLNEIQALYLDLAAVSKGWSAGCGSREAECVCAQAFNKYTCIRQKIIERTAAVVKMVEACYEDCDRTAPCPCPGRPQCGCNTCQRYYQ